MKNFENFRRWKFSDLFENFWKFSEPKIFKNFQAWKFSSKILELKIFSISKIFEIENFSKTAYTSHFFLRINP